MTEDTYKGLCIGGPADGEMRESGGNILTVPYRVQLPPEKVLKIEPVGMSTFVRLVHYQFVPLQFGDAHRGLWVLENATPIKVLDALIAGYKKP